MLYSETTDPHLIESIKDWREDAGWQRFYDLYSSSIRNHARASGLSDSEAEDVIQETMIKVARYLPKFDYNRTICRFRTWLNQIVNQQIFDAVHRRCKNLYSSVNLDELREALHSTDAAVGDPIAQAESERKLIETCLARVRAKTNPEHWQIFEANALHDLPGEKVATLHGTSVTNVWVVRHRILNALRREWRKLNELPFLPVKPK
jgi:RNA polymerase sigma factor (sigma-70 family)